MKNDDHIPAQLSGSSMDVVEQTAFSTVGQAKQFYEKAKERLLNVSEWHRISGLPAATFQLTDRKGNDVSGILKQELNVRIDLAGPGTLAGDGYDWVVIEKVTEYPGKDEEFITVTLRPCANPGSDNHEIAHFLKQSATSNLQIRRKGIRVYAGFYGRNEEPNTSVDHLADKARNFMVANASRWGLAYPHWKKLMQGLIER